MMAVNRVSQINFALAQAAGVSKILNFISKCTDNVKKQVLYKELASSASNLATTLAAKREFATQIDGTMFQIDPRFMLFEFCHNLLLRKAQVDLVNKLVNELHEGKSVCHQVRNTSMK
jgi:hypothetical protein